MTRRTTRALAALCVTAGMATGCSSSEFTGVYNLPLPGGADLGAHPYRVTVRFPDVLDLVPQSAVKVNDVTVGKVESIGLAADGWTAQVVVAVNGEVVLPADAIARLRQSSLLGEKFVELSAPADYPGTGAAPVTSVPTGRLTDGAVIPPERTNRSPELEEVFGALSLLLNGGGIGQLQTIDQELTKATKGNEPEIRSFLSNVDTLAANLDAHRDEITQALDGLHKLSTTLAHRKEQVSGALTDLSPGLRTLSQQRSALVNLLQALDRLSSVAVDTITRSKDDLVADLKSLAPILGKLAEAGRNLPQSLEILFSFPFTDPVLDAIKGDYLNVFATTVPDPGMPVPVPIPTSSGSTSPPLPLPSSGQAEQAPTGGRP